MNQEQHDNYQRLKIKEYWGIVIFMWANSPWCFAIVDRPWI